MPNLSLLTSVAGANQPSVDTHPFIRGLAVLCICAVALIAFGWFFKRVERPSSRPARRPRLPFVVVTALWLTPLATNALRVDPNGLEEGRYHRGTQPAAGIDAPLALTLRDGPMGVYVFPPK